MTYDIIKKKGIKTMKKLFSKLGSLLLAAAILMSLVPAALADNVAVRAIGARTITVNEIAQGDTVKAYRLVKYADASYNSFQFYSDFGTFLDHFATSAATPMTKEAYLATMSAEGIANVLGPMPQPLWPATRTTPCPRTPTRSSLPPPELMRRPLCPSSPATTCCWWRPR